MVVFSNLRKVARKTSYKTRYTSLSSNEQVYLRDLKKLIKIFLVKFAKEDSNITIENEKEKALKRIATQNMLTLVILRYQSISSMDDDMIAERENDEIPRLDRTIDSFTNCECKSYFPYKKPELLRVFKVLNFEPVVVLPNRAVMTGEEVYLRGLFELCGGEDQFKICKLVFGGNQPLQSFALNYFLRFVHRTQQHLVHNNLEWWNRNGFTKQSADAIQDRIRMAGFDGDAAYLNRVAYFIDCNCLATDRVGGGPAEEGANSARWDPLIQRAFYNGWKSLNGLKHQTVDNAFGCTCDMTGPTSLRRNDLTLLRISDINDRLHALHANDPIDYIIFGDSAYKRRSNITSYVSAAAGEVAIDPLFKAWNKAMKTVRISIEWNYGATGAMFKYLLNKRKLRVKKSSEVSLIYTVATILRNFSVGLYGGQTSNYFGIRFPETFLEHYVNGTDIRA
jgi:hypothetical protein